MFNKFFSKKDESKSRPPHSGNTEFSNESTQKEEDSTTGGGFFNLPPVGSNKGASAPTPTQKVNSMASSPPSGRSSINGSVGGSLFDNMAIKNPTPTSQEAAPTAPNMFANLKTRETPRDNIPNNGYNIRPSINNSSSGTSSLFDNMAIKTPTTAALETTVNPPNRILKPKEANKEMNKETVKDTNALQRNRSVPTIPSNMNVKKKKKKKTTTVGIYSNLSEDAAAALQQGGGKPTLWSPGEENSLGSAVELSPTVSIPSGSVSSILSGLTLHTQSSISSEREESQIESTTVPISMISSSGSIAPTGILDGLTLHSNTQGSVGSSGDSIGTTNINASLISNISVTEPLTAKSVEKTPEEKLRQTLVDFELSATQFRRNIEALTEEEKKLIIRRDLLETQLAGYKTDLSRVESLQEKASEEEDFDRAEQLNSNINSIKHCITLADSDLRRLEVDVDGICSSKEKAFAKQLTLTKGTFQELELFRDDQEKCRSDCEKMFKEFEAKEAERLTFEDERVHSELHHVIVNLEHLDEERAQIESTIEDQCKEEMETKRSLLSQKDMVQSEIDELKSKLDAKIHELATVSKELTTVEGQIAVVRKKFSRQIHRLDIREEGIQKTKREIDYDISQLELQKDSFKSKREEFLLETESYNLRIKSVKKELQTAQQLSDTLKMRDDRRKLSAAGKKEKASQLAQLREAACLAEQQYRVISKQQTGLQTRVVDYHATITSADTCLPRLEQEKKLAASQRNFKEAGRISKEIKKLEADKEKAMEELDIAQAELEELENISRARLGTQTEKESKLRAVEREMDLKLLQELWEDAKHLRIAIRKIKDRKNTDEYNCMSPRGGPDFEAAAVILLSAELEACNADADDLHKKYGIDPPDIDDEVDEEEEFEKSSIGNMHSHQENLNLENISAQDIEEKIMELEGKIEEATEVEDYELAAHLDEEMVVLRDRLEQLSRLNQSTDSIAQEQHEDVDKEEDGEVISVDELTERIQTLESELQEATEQEEYDLADTLYEELQAVRLKLKAVSSSSVVEDKGIHESESLSQEELSKNAKIAPQDKCEETLNVSTQVDKEENSSIDQGQQNPTITAEAVTSSFGTSVSDHVENDPSSSDLLEDEESDGLEENEMEDPEGCDDGELHVEAATEEQVESDHNDHERFQDMDDHEYSEGEVGMAMGYAEEFQSPTSHDGDLTIENESTSGLDDTEGDPSSVSHPSEKECVSVPPEEVGTNDVTPAIVDAVEKTPENVVENTESIDTSLYAGMVLKN